MGPFWNQITSACLAGWQGHYYRLKRKSLKDEMPTSSGVPEEAGDSTSSARGGPPVAPISSLPALHISHQLPSAPFTRQTGGSQPSG